MIKMQPTSVIDCLIVYYLETTSELSYGYEMAVGSESLTLFRCQVKKISKLTGWPVGAE